MENDLTGFSMHRFAIGVVFIFGALVTGLFPLLGPAVYGSTLMKMCEGEFKRAFIYRVLAAAMTGIGIAAFAAPFLVAGHMATIEFAGYFAAFQVGSFILSCVIAGFLYRQKMGKPENLHK